MTFATETNAMRMQSRQGTAECSRGSADRHTTQTHRRQAPKYLLHSLHDAAKVIMNGFLSADQSQEATTNIHIYSSSITNRITACLGVKNNFVHAAANYARTKNISACHLIQWLLLCVGKNSLH